MCGSSSQLVKSTTSSLILMIALRSLRSVVPLSVHFAALNSTFAFVAAGNRVILSGWTVVSNNLARPRQVSKVALELLLSASDVSDCVVHAGVGCRCGSKGGSGR